MNKQIYDLVMAILGSDLTKDSKDDIVRFYTLPRNTPVRPMIEMPDEDIQDTVGSVKRSTSKETDKMRHPEKYAGANAVRDTLRERIIPDTHEQQES